jgi:hypothetical protein
VVDELAGQYDAAGLPVLFLEQNVYTPVGNRIDRYHDARGEVACGVPWVIVESGLGVTCGREDFAVAYRALVDDALARPALADVWARYRRFGDSVEVTADVTNRSGHSLGFGHWPTVNALVYERASVVHTGRFVRAASQTELVDDLPDGATAHVSLVLANVPVANWSKATVVVIADYRPEPGQARFASLQSAIAVEVTATPTHGPTATQVATPTPGPTFPPDSPKAFLPFALRN